MIPLKWALIVAAELAGCVGLGYLLALRFDALRRERCTPTVRLPGAWVDELVAVAE